MKISVYKRIVSGNLLLLIALALFTFGLLSVGTVQTAHAATANIEHPFGC